MLETTHQQEQSSLHSYLTFESQISIILVEILHVANKDYFHLNSSFPTLSYYKKPRRSFPSFLFNIALPCILKTTLFHLIKE